MTAPAASFFVKNKDGNIRLVIDARVADLYHQVPPKASLAGALSMVQIDSGPEAFAIAVGAGWVVLGASKGERRFDPHGFGAGAKDGFFQLSAPELASYFCFNGKLRPQDFGAHVVWDDHLEHLTPVKDELMHPCM